MQITGTARSAPVSFATAEPNANYQVLLGVDSISGTAVVTAPYASVKSTTGFTANLPTAPGAGNSVTLSWLLVRLS